MNSVRANALLLVTFLLAILQMGHGQGMAASPAPASVSVPFPSNDGKAIDQGIAYVLLLVALAITYLIH